MGEMRHSQERRGSGHSSPRGVLVSARAHVEVMKATKPSMSESSPSWLVLLNRSWSKALQGEAYTGIFAGKRTMPVRFTIGFNEDKLNDGDLLLVDHKVLAVARFIAVISRGAYPVNGPVFIGTKTDLPSHGHDLQMKLIANDSPRAQAFDAAKRPRSKASPKLCWMKKLLKGNGRRLYP